VWWDAVGEPRPPQEVWAARAQDAAQHEHHDERVVELTGNGDEVGDEVKWHREVADQRAQQELAAARHPSIEQQSVNEGRCNRGQSPAARACVALASSTQEPDHECDVDGCGPAGLAYT